MRYLYGLVIWVALMGGSFIWEGGQMRAVAAAEPTQRGTPTLNRRIERERVQLKRLKEELQRHGDQVRRSRRQEQSVLEELRAINHRLRLSQREWYSRDRDLKRYQERRVAIERRFNQTADSLKLQQASLKVRLRALYKQGEQPYFRVVFAAPTLPELQQRARFMEALAAHDVQLITDFQKHLQGIGQVRAELEETIAQITRLRQQAEEKRGEIAREHQRKQQLLARVKGEQAYFEKTKRELEEAATELQALIRRLEEQQRQERARGEKRPRAPAGPGLANRKGLLTWPVEGAVLTTFGKTRNQRFNVDTVFKGIDIQAPTGTKVRAVAAGKVLYSNWLKGYGKLLIIDHGDHYYSLYGHLEEIFVITAERVEAEQVVASVGEDESLKGPILHFEIRYRGVAEDPVLWLRQARVNPGRGSEQVERRQ